MSHSQRIAFFGAIVTCLIPIAAGATISRNLRLGDRGTDVRELQVAMNRDPSTRVAETGPGSPGGETEYFGPLTDNAVRRFQQKYASEILTPIGLTAPTGFVGAKTRLYVSKLEKTFPPAPPPAGGPPPQAEVNPRLSITSASPTIITKLPQEVSITGSGFTQYGNSVITSTESKNAFVNLPSADRKTIRFRYTFQIAEEFKKMANKSATATATPQDILRAISQNIWDPAMSTTTTKVPLMLQVKNANGESNTLRLLIDMPSVLLGEN